MTFQFQPEKAVASIGYLVQKTGADLYSVMKMLYLADKLHLGRYGRTITGDSYTAMSKGPVPERAYNLCKYVRGSHDRFDPMPSARNILSMTDNNFELLVEPDLDELSLSDIEALEEVAAVHIRGGWRAVYEQSHDKPWSAAWEAAQSVGLGSVNIDIREIARDSGGDTLVDFLLDPHPGSAADPVHGRACL